VYCAQTAEDIDSPMSLPDSIDIWLTSVDPFLSEFFPNFADLSVADTFWQIAAEWLEISKYSK